MNSRSESVCPQACPWNQIPVVRYCQFGWQRAGYNTTIYLESLDVFNENVLGLVLHLSQHTEQVQEAFGASIYTTLLETDTSVRLTRWRHGPNIGSKIVIVFC